MGRAPFPGTAKLYGAPCPGGLLGRRGRRGSSTRAKAMTKRLAAFDTRPHTRPHISLHSLLLLMSARLLTMHPVAHCRRYWRTSTRSAQRPASARSYGHQHSARLNCSQSSRRCQLPRAARWILSLASWFPSCMWSSLGFYCAAAWLCCGRLLLRLRRPRRVRPARRVRWAGRRTWAASCWRLQRYCCGRQWSSCYQRNRCRGGLPAGWMRPRRHGRLGFKVTVHARALWRIKPL